MVLTRWDPFRNMNRVDRWIQRPAFPFQDGEPGRWRIPVDIVRDDDSFTVRAGLPGMEADDINVSIVDGMLIIKAENKHEDERQSGHYLVRERHFGAFSRAVRLPANVDADQAKPRYENGVLTVTLPVAEASKPKQLKVSTAGATPEAS